jgi:transcriptional regulator with XRE-family HTH domain
MRHPWHHRLPMTDDLAFRLALGERIRETRVSLNMSQRQFAEEIGTTRSAVSRYENGSRMTVEVLRRIAECLGLSLDGLMQNRSAAE